MQFVYPDHRVRYALCQQIEQQVTPRGAKSGDHSHPDGWSILKRCRFSAIHLSGLPSFQLCLITWCFRPLSSISLLIVFTPLSLKHSGLITSNEHQYSCSNSPTSQDQKESIASHVAVNKTFGYRKKVRPCIVSLVFRLYIVLLSGFLLSYSFWSFRNPVVSCLQGFAGPGEAASLMRHTWRASRPHGLQTVLLCQRGVAPVHNIMAAAMKAKDQVWPSVPSLQWTFLHICLFVEIQCLLETYGSMHPKISFIGIYVKEVIHVQIDIGDMRYE